MPHRIIIVDIKRPAPALKVSGVTPGSGAAYPAITGGRHSQIENPSQTDPRGPARPSVARRADWAARVMMWVYAFGSGFGLALAFAWEGVGV